MAGELQKINDSEINVSIGWMRDGGVTLRLGDETLGGLKALLAARSRISGPSDRAYVDVG